MSVGGMDFASDRLFNGRRFRALTVVDIVSRECLGIEVAQGIKGDDVVEVLDFYKVVSRRSQESYVVTMAPSSYRRFWIDGLTRTK